MKKGKLLIIIPVFNESSSIGNLISDIRKNKLPIDFDIIIINDCSTDDSLDVIRSLKCNYISLPTNLGIGGAMQTGYKYALEHNYSYTLQIDGDGQHPPSEIHHIIKAMKNTDNDIIIGSRYINKTGFQSTRLRRIGTNFLSRLIRLLIKTQIKDVTSGFRMLNAKATKIAAKYYPDEYPEPESIIIFKLHNLNISEVPVNMADRQGGISSIREFYTIYYMLKVSLALVFTFFRFNNKKGER